MCQGRTKCCFCCSLRDGSIIIAALGIAFGVISSDVHISILVSLHYFECEDENSEVKMTKFAAKVCKNLDRLNIVFGLLLAWAVVKILFSVLLFFGVNKRAKKMVIPWLAVQVLKVLVIRPNPEDLINSKPDHWKCSVGDLISWLGSVLC